MAGALVGVLVIFRHGDRQGFYQSPTSYSASDTAITPLGEQQEYQLGTTLRERYFEPSSSYYIDGLNGTLVNASQVVMSADAGGEGGVIFDSAVALTQGLFPANPSRNTTLANGTTIVSPLGGYQYLPVESVEVEEDYTLESWTDCPAYTSDNTAWYSSSAFRAKAEENADFLASLKPITGDRSLDFANMWNIFDYINVNYIHSAAFAEQVSDATRGQVRDLANWHEYYSFSDVSPSAIGNIAGRAMLPPIFEALSAFPDASQPMRFRGIGISYKPFISLFNMTGVAQSYPALAGVVDYAAAVALEVRQDSTTNSYTVTLNFRNGTSDSDFAAYNMFGSSSPAYPLDDLISTLSPHAVSSLGQWCNECQNTYSRGCDTIYALNETTEYTGPASTLGRHHVSPLAAGFIGAVVTLILGGAILGVLWLLGMAAFNKRGSATKRRYDLGFYNLPDLGSKSAQAAS